MYSVTTFEWKAGELDNMLVKTAKDLFIFLEYPEIRIMDNRNGELIVTFRFKNGRLIGGRDCPQEAWGFIEKVIEQLIDIKGDKDFCLANDEHHSFTAMIAPISGEPLTETMMQKYVSLMRLCGKTEGLIAPRILTETFEGDVRRHDEERLPYGKYLLRKVCAK